MDTVAAADNWLKSQSVLTELMINSMFVNDFLDTINPEIRSWKYIEFRCMIQDTLEHKIFGRYKDGLDGTKMFYCTSIPGENEWVQRYAASIGRPSRIELAESKANTGDQERLSISLVNNSFPIPDGKNESCLIKVYDPLLSACLNVNDIIQVGGFLEPNEFEHGAKLLTIKTSPHCEGELTPTASNHHCKKNRTSRNSDSKTECNSDYTQCISTELDNPVDPFKNGFKPAEDFPKWLVPRIHVRAIRKPDHINPLIMTIPPIINLDRSKMARARLSTILLQLLGGDALMTEYLILSLISRIHKRNGKKKFGQLSMCLSGFKPEMRFVVEKLYEIISKITTNSHYIDLSIANLNNLRFTPERDIDNNKMIAGTLQLPNGFYLMLSETSLSEGLLTAQGTANLSTLNHIIQWQSHKYNFKSHSVDIDTDLKILVISEGKSILNVPLTVPIEKNDPETIKNMRQACESVDDFLSEDLLNTFRDYITSLVCTKKYDEPTDVYKLILQHYFGSLNDSDHDEEFLNRRKEMESRMTLARYLTLSVGETTLTRDLWQQVCQMESARVDRLRDIKKSRFIAEGYRAMVDKRLLCSNCVKTIDEA